jgi:hypothetical protein
LPQRVTRLFRGGGDCRFDPEFPDVLVVVIVHVYVVVIVVVIVHGPVVVIVHVRSFLGARLAIHS